MSLLIRGEKPVLKPPKRPSRRSAHARSITCRARAGMMSPALLLTRPRARGIAAAPVTPSAGVSGGPAVSPSRLVTRTSVRLVQGQLPGVTQSTTEGSGLAAGWGLWLWQPLGRGLHPQFASADLSGPTVTVVRLRSKVGHVVFTFGNAKATPRRSGPHLRVGA